MDSGAQTWTLDFQRPSATTLVIFLAGNWRLSDGLPSAQVIKDEVSADIQSVSGLNSGKDLSGSYFRVLT